MPSKTDRYSWSELWKRLQANPNSEQRIFDLLVAAYWQPTRTYHNLEHIGHMLQLLDSVQSQIQQFDVVELATWFHDFVYEPTKRDNEERSADAAARLLSEAQLDKSLIERTKRLILLTKTHQAPEKDADASFFLDIDLAILGATPDHYRRYASAIRQEYSMFSEEEYRAGRCQVLLSLLKRPRIYGTDTLSARFEATARSNLEAELRALNDA